MPIWVTAPVDEVPELVLVNFFIAETDIGERHFVGYNLTEHEGRVSSAIQQFDIERRRGVTRSGRVYQLRGEAGLDGDAIFTWTQWCRINKVESWKDVTAEVLGGA